MQFLTDLQQQLDSLKEITLGSNSLYDYTLAFGVFIAIVAAFKLLHAIILHRLAVLAQKTKVDIDELLLQIVSAIRFPALAIAALYIATLFLQLPDLAAKIASVIFIVVIIYQIISIARIIIEYIISKKIGDTTSGQGEIAIQSVGLAVQIILWSLGLLFILSNFGIDITSLIAALGVGGIAIAFALQQILSDLFGSFAIYFDKPFVPGDFIIVGDKMGTVETIGIKTTRIKSLEGEELVFSNQELTTQPIQNYQRMSERRISFEFGLDYTTTPAQIRAALEGIKNIISHIDQVRLDRVHFKQFGESSLIIETVYYFESPDYNQYMDANQEIMLSIQEMLANKKIKLALPRQAVYVETAAK